MKANLTFLLVFASLSAYGQESNSKVYQIQFKDITSYQAVPNVQVRYSCTLNVGVIKTDGSGNFFINCSDNLRLTISADLYKSQTGMILREENALYRKGDTITFHVFMEPKKDVVKAETVITNPYKPQEIFASERLSVSDFEILDDNNLLLLTYERQLKKGAELLLVDGNQKVQFSQSLGKTARNLFTDFRGFVHLMYQNHLELVFLTDDAFDLVAMDKQYYMRFIAPIIDTTKNKYYFTNYRSTYPAADFFVYDGLDSTYLKISRISDEIMMDMFIKEYLWMDTRTKLWARQMEQETGIDKEDIVGEAIFTQSIFYKEIYAPMFVVNDTVYLFDFYKDYVRSFDLNGQKLDSVAITMHHWPKSTGWCNRLIQDPKTGSIYAVFDKGGYTIINPVNLKDGTLGLPTRLDFRYVEKLVIHNNAVYYTYRPFESDQKKYLYKQQLPQFFDLNNTAVDRRQPSKKED